MSRSTLYLAHIIYVLVSEGERARETLKDLRTSVLEGEKNEQLSSGASELIYSLLKSVDQLVSEGAITREARMRLVKT